MKDLHGAKFVRIIWTQMGSESYAKQLNDALPHWIRDGILKPIPTATTKSKISMRLH